MNEILKLKKPIIVNADKWLTTHINRLSAVKYINKSDVIVYAYTDNPTNEKNNYIIRQYAIENGYSLIDSFLSDFILAFS